MIPPDILNFAFVPTKTAPPYPVYVSWQFRIAPPYIFNVAFVDTPNSPTEIAPPGLPIALLF